MNVPRVIVALLAVMGAIHLLRAYWLTPQEDFQTLLEFAFIPARYDNTLLGAAVLPGGDGARLWSFLTYAFLHADATHILVNSVWLLAFGSAVARRFGTARLLAFFALTAAAGAAAHLATHPGEMVPVIGASAAISGMMAGAIRFIFGSGGPLSSFRMGDDRMIYSRPALPLLQTLRDTRVLIFLAVWFGLNLLLGLGVDPLVTAGQTVAWQAHIGGFVAGLLLFPFFDPIGGTPRDLVQDNKPGGPRGGG